MRTDPTFGTRLRALRRASGKTQADVAYASQIDHTYLSRIESGRDEAPSEATIGRLLAAVDAPASEYEPLLLLAGKIPRDVRDIILAHPEACGLLRERWGNGR